MADSWPRLSTVVAFIGLLVAFALGPLSAIVSHVLVRTVPFALGLACAIWLMAPDLDANDTRNWEFWSFSTSGMVMVTVVVNVLIVSLVPIAVHFQGRGLVFYVVAAGAATALLLQIVFTEDTHVVPRLILFQIVMLAFFLRFGALYFAPSLIGVDVWIHIHDYVQGIVDSGSLEPLSESKYLTAPMYHTLVAATAILGGVSVEYGLYYSVGLGMVFSILAVYVTIARISGVRWALFATTLYSVSDFVLVWGLHLIPTSLGIIFFLMCASMLVMRMDGAIEGGRGVMVLIGVFIAAVVFTHQVSAFILVVFLLCGVFAQFLLSSSLFGWVRSASHSTADAQGVVFNIVGYTVFALGITTLSWTVTDWYGQSFLVSILNILLDALQGGGVESRMGAVPTQDFGLFSAATLIPYIDYMGLVLLMFAMMLAVLYIIDQWNYVQSHMTLLFAGIVMLGFALIPPVFGLRTFLPGRWFAFLYFPLAVLTAVGLSTIRIQLSASTFAVIMIVFAVVFPGSMIMTSNAMMDNPLFSNHVPRYMHTGQEMSAMETTEDIVDDEVVIWTDFQYANNGNELHQKQQYESLLVSSESGGGVDPGAEWRLYREYQSEGVPLWNVLGAPGQQQTTLSRDAVCGGADGHVAYSNGDVVLCSG